MNLSKEKIKTIGIIVLTLVIILGVTFIYLKPQYDNSLLQKGYNAGVYGLSYEQSKTMNYYFVTEDNNITYVPITQICSQITGVQNEK
jgi:hypothetical protein